MLRHVAICLTAFYLLLSACTAGPGQEKARKWMSANGRIKVLSTIAMIEDLVKEVGGAHVDTLTLVGPGLDPHTYQLVKGDDEKLAAADLIFYNGLGLEHGPSLRQFLQESPNAVGLGDLVMQESPGLILRYNGSIDPHIWMDLSIWKRTVRHIADTLARYDPEHGSVYRENAEQLEEAMMALHQKLEGEMREVPPERRFLVTSHDAFNYFARSYLATDEEKQSDAWQKRFAAPEGLAPESQLSTSDIRMILDHMKKYNIRDIFPESNVSQASIRKLVNAGEDMGVIIKIAPDHLYGDAMGPPGSSGDSYYKMLKHNVRTIAKHLNDDE